LAVFFNIFDWRNNNNQNNDYAEFKQNFKFKYNYTKAFCILYERLYIYDNVLRCFLRITLTYIFNFSINDNNVLSMRMHEYINMRVYIFYLQLVYRCLIFAC
jgi:hypothetical protein